MFTRLFWILFAAEAIALLLFLIGAFRQTSRSPEGPVGAWILFLPPLGMLAAGTLFATVRWEPVRWACFLFLLYPLVLMAASPLVRRHKDRQVERSMAGDDDFPAGPFREIAHAIRQEDASRVRALVPAAGDLNRHFGGDTILRFAVANTKRTDIVEPLLQAGADPNVATAYGDVPLAMAFYAGPEMVALLLKAGSDANQTDGAGRPLWWSILTNSTEDGLATLALLGTHSADFRLRDGESGPVGWASYHNNWRAVWWLMEHGAAWRDEQRWGTSAYASLERDIASREAEGREVPPEAYRIRNRFQQP